MVRCYCGWGPLRVLTVIAFQGYGYCVLSPWLVRLLAPCEGRVVKGAAGNGTENTGETGPAFAWPGVIGTRGRKVPRHVAPERG